MRIQQFIFLMTVMALFSGCRPVSSPWAGTPYETPQPVESAGRSTFAPTPTILPVQVAPTVDAASQDAALERFLLKQRGSKVSGSEDRVF